MDRLGLVARIDAAKRDLTDAEADIAALLRDLRVSPRAEKTTISAALEAAFAKLHAARLNLEALDALLAKDREAE